VVKKRTSTDPFAELNWADLNRWAGGKIVGRGKDYQRTDAVAGLARTPEGGLLAWVDGTRRYATFVERDARGNLSTMCTCPYEGVCKHAVAVVLEYLACLEKETPVPQARKNDERFEEFDLSGDDDDDDVDDLEGEDEEMTPDKGAADRIESFLKGKTRAELVRLIRDLAARHPAVSTELTDRRCFSEGRSGALVKEIRREIRKVTSSPGWQDYWKHTGYIPDYSGVLRRLEALLEAGYADEVLDLADELLEAGTRHVEESDDEGETAAEFVTCVDVIAEALVRSARPAAGKLIWTIETMLSDEYDLFGPLESYLERPHEQKDWSAVADQLQKRLSAFIPSRREDEWSNRYERDRIADWVILVLTRSGRDPEILPLCEKEAKETGSYERLVVRLMEAGSHEEAEKWIFAGLKAVGEKQSGPGSSLRGRLLELRKKQKDWQGAASLLVDEFLRRPLFDAYKDCRKATQRKDLWPRVRQGLMHFLECGAFPWEEKDWPLPAAGIPPPAKPHSRDVPMRRVLIDIAIHEKQPDQVLRWYDARPSSGIGSGSMEDRVATAVADHAPDRAAALWKKLAEREIAAVKPSAYEAAAVYLRKLFGLLKKLNREAEWKDYLVQLRAVHMKKRRLMEILDNVEKGPIVKSVRR
jgi:uncharacterized Zn finger protein